MEQSELLSSFLQEAQEVLGSLEAGVQDLHGAEQPSDDPERLARLSVLAHRLRGSAGLYGFAQLSKMAALLERLLDSRPALHGEERARFLQVLDITNLVLRQGLDGILSGAGESDLGLSFSREGGAARLQELLKLSPAAFKPRPHEQVHYQEQEEHLAANQDAADPKASESVELRLRHFVQENAEVWEYFSPEVQEHLSALRAQLDQDEGDLDVMFRAAHTVKGSSYMVGLNILGDFAHRSEDLLGAVRDGLVRLDAPVREALHDALSLMERVMRVAGGAEEEVGHDLNALSARLSALASGQPSSDPAPMQAAPGQSNSVQSDPAQPDATQSDPTQNGPAVAQPSTPSNFPGMSAENTSIRVPARQLEVLMDQMGELVTARARLGQTLERLDELQQAMYESQVRFQRTVRDFEERHLNPDMLRVAGDNQAGQDGGADGLNLTQQFDELELDSYSDLNILARSITELSADFAEVRRRLTDAVTDLQDENDLMGKLMRRLRSDVSQTSRVNFTQLTGRLKRWAKEHQDRFELIVEGEENKVDSGVLQRLMDPLLHLLTNALHHGIGSAEERVAAGKDPLGRVWLVAQQRANFLEITVKDDGRGLNLDAIQARALAKGLRSALELERMSDLERTRLILLPGLSTAEQVNTVAGRGVGMDVVATATRQLGGELLIHTEPGAGTTFTLRVPTARRIMDILRVWVGEHPLAFAVNSVKALRELTKEDLSIGEQGFEVPYEDQMLPLLDLREMWGMTEPSDAFQVVILSTLSGEVAVRVDEFGKIEESSVTPPSALLSGLEYLNGTALSASGDVVPILDPHGLTRLARRPDTWLQAQGSAPQASRRLLLVDDSLSVRRLVGRMLERAGYLVETANDGQEALEKLQLDEGFDVVISDLEMPRMNGYELLSALRARAATAKLPLMIMTTRAGEKHQRLAFQMGANDYFTKPVNEGLLLRRMEALIGVGLTGVGQIGVEG